MADRERTEQKDEPTEVASAAPPEDAVEQTPAPEAGGPAPPAGGFEEPADASEGFAPPPPETAGGRSEGSQSPLEAGLGDHGLADEHPEALVGAAFVGGLAFALILRRLGPS
jgi:hypothetical protein